MRPVMLVVLLAILVSESQELSVGPLGPAEILSNFWQGTIPPPYPPIKADDVTFQLFTRDPNSGTFLNPKDDSTFLKSSFNASNPTKFATHGFEDNGNSTYLREFRKFLLKSGEYNYIQFDWSRCANRTYIAAMGCMQDVGSIIGKFVNQLVRLNKASLNDMHLIGHSLGAQLMGIVSKSVGKGKLGRITGLDPASPKFENVGPEMRIDPSDAQIVDTMVTGLDNFGIKKVIGQINFYPNADQLFQPGCTHIDTLEDACNHLAAVAFFVDTVIKGNRKKYIATRCDSVAQLRTGRCNGEKIVMGLELFQTTPGIYYIRIPNRPNLNL